MVSNHFSVFWDDKIQHFYYHCRLFSWDCCSKYPWTSLLGWNNKNVPVFKTKVKSKQLLGELYTLQKFWGGRIPCSSSCKFSCHVPCGYIFSIFDSIGLGLYSSFFLSPLFFVLILSLYSQEYLLLDLEAHPVKILIQYPLFTSAEITSKYGCTHRFQMYK